MNEQTCPYLGILGPETEQKVARDYPSFENCCFTESVPTHGALLLADQSTYCLSGGYHQCPRFQSLATTRFGTDSHARIGPGMQDVGGFEVPTTSIPLDSEYLSGMVDQPDFDLGNDFADDGDDDGEERIGAVWLLAGSTFTLVFLIGMGFAAYLGWRLVSTSALADSTPGQIVGDTVEIQTENGVITLADVGVEDSAQYVIQTATPDSNVDTGGDTAGADGIENDDGGNSGNEISDLAVVSQPPTSPTVPVAVLKPPVEGQNTQEQNGQIQQSFPAAVTPTPIVVTAGSNQGSSGENGIAQIVNPQDVTGPNAGQNAPPTSRPTPTIVPEINVQVIVPTSDPRVIPAVPVVPDPAEIPTETPTPTATWLPPLVLFSAEELILQEGKCTNIFWEVQNVRAVYIENIGVDGKGKKEVCITDNDREYDLVAVLPDGSVENHFVTVAVATRTPVPTPTWTFTPLPEPTPTWTPQPPTPTQLPTPPPSIARGARLDTAQPQGAAPISCAAGASCEIGLLATNSGDGVDSLVIIMAERSQPGWSAMICRQDGVCSAERLVLTNVGEANTAFITLRLQVPADATSQVITYNLYAASQESGETVRSETLILDVTIP